MRKLHIGKSFKSKNFRYGGYSTFVTSIILAIIILLNLGVGKLDLKLDLTKNKLFSLSEQTITILKELKTDVKIITLSSAGNEDAGIKEILNKYVSNSKKITLETVDPEQHPEIVKNYAEEGSTIETGSIIVESGKKYKVIDSYDLYNISEENQVESLAVEQRVTSALMYVTSERNPSVFTLMGHNETEISPDLSKALENENYTVQELSLLSGEWKPETGDILLINSPKRDISVEESNKIKDYLSKGGRALIFVDLVKEDLPNMKQLFSAYGVSMDKAVILEGSTKNTVAGNNLYLVPNLGVHTITSPLVNSKVPVITYAAQPIQQEKNKKDSIKIESILTTSDKAYAKVNLQAKTKEKEAGDLNGPFDLAVAIEDQIDANDNSKNPRIVLFSSSAIMESSIVSMSNQGNIDIIMNSMNWLIDRKESISIRAKSLAADTLSMTASQQLTVAAVTIILIPLAITVFGVTVWLRRRHL